MSKRVKWSVAGGVLLVVPAIGGLTAAKGKNKSVEVRTEQVAQRDLVASVTASGQVRPQTKVDLSSDITGKIVRLAVKEGQMVKQGQFLLQIDPQQQEAAVQRVEAALASSRAQMAQAQANLLQAQKSYERTSLGKTTIYAPMSGRVTRLNVENGETAIMGTLNKDAATLLTIADMSVLETKVKVDETDVARISLGDSAVIQIDAFPDTTFVGRVVEISNSAVKSATAQATNADQAVDYEVTIQLVDPPKDTR